MTHAQFLQLAADYKLKHIGQQLLSTTVPAVRALDNAMRQAQPDDKTFIGGMPVPMPRHWPRYKETPLTFVAQVDTAALPPDICPTVVPDGILQFFVPSTSAANDYEPSLDCGRVIFVSGGNPEHHEDNKTMTSDSAADRTEPPAQALSLMSQVVRFFRSAAHFRSIHRPESPPTTVSKRSFEWEVFPTLHGSAPDPESLWLPESVQSFEFDHEADWDSYFEFRRAVMACTHWNWLVQMFGFANEQQDDMQPLVATASGRRSLDEYREWILLFALNSAMGGLAPEAVCYYFWIHRDDLADAKFEEVWLCVQQD